MLFDTDKEAIKRTTERCLAVFNARDLPAYVRFYTEDAVIFPQNAPAVKGHEAILSFLQKIPPFSDYRHETQELEGMGNLVYNLETYSATVMPPGLPSFRLTGRVIWIWQKQADESWKVWREMFNSDLPAPEGAPSGQ